MRISFAVAWIVLALAACTGAREADQRTHVPNDAGDRDSEDPGDGSDVGDGDDAGARDDAGDGDGDGGSDRGADDGGHGDGGVFDLACGSGFLCESVATLGDDVRDIAVGEGLSSVYWTHAGTRDALGKHRGDGAVRRLKSSRQIETVFDSLGPTSELWIDGARIFWLEGASTHASLFFAELSTGDDPGAAASEPSLLRTGSFADFHIRDGVAAWRDESATVSGSTAILTWDLRELPAPEPVMHTFESGGRLVGLELDSGALVLYVTFSSTRITRVAGGIAVDVLAEPAIHAVTFGTYELSLAHADADDRVWLSTMRKTGGALTNHFELENNISQIVSVGSSIWTIDTANDSRRCRLLAKTPEENPEYVALDWLVMDGERLMDAQAPRWAADEWNAWVLIGDQLIEVVIDED